MSRAGRISGPKIYRFKLRQGDDGDYWTTWYPAMSYSDARRQMRLKNPHGKLLDYEMENTHG
jgi:hypothetical protein